MSTTAKARPRLAQESVGHEVMIKAWYGSNPPHQTLNCRQPRRNPRKPWSGYGPLVSVAGRLFDETLRRALFDHHLHRLVFGGANGNAFPIREQEPLMKANFPDDVFSHSTVRRLQACILRQQPCVSINC